MPFKRRYYKKKKYGRRKPVTKGQVYRIAKKAISHASEKKEYNIATDGRPGYATGAETNVNLVAIAQGDGMTERDGREIIAKSVTVCGRAQLADACRDSQIIRVTVIRMLDQTKDTNPGQGEIYRDDGTIDVVNGMWSRQGNGGRYRVLKDFTMRLRTSSTSSDTTASGEFKFFRFKVPLNFKVQYNGAAATDINQNGVFLLITSTAQDSVADPTNTPYVYVTARTIFIDP